MRRPLLLLATFVLGIASIFTTFVSVSMAPPSNSASSEPADVAAVQRYYAAVNEMIATGDPTALREILHPEMIDLDPRPNGGGGRDTIEDQAASLHAVAPDARLAPGPIAGDGARVIAQVTVRRDSSSLPLGLTLNTPSILWPSFETFQVSNGQIIERSASWRGQAAIHPAAPFPFVFDIPVLRTLNVSVGAYDPGATGHFVNAETPAILRLVSGNLEFSLSSTASESAFVESVSSVARSETRERVLPGEVRSLNQGEVVVVPPGSGFNLRNDRERQAEVLSVTVSVPTAGGPESATDAQGLQVGLSTVTLLGLMTDNVSGPAQLSLGTALLMPGASLGVDPSTRLMILWPDADGLSTTPRQSACLDADGAGSAPVDTGPHLANLQLLCPDQTVETAVFNAGDEPATTWVVAVTATPHAG